MTRLQRTARFGLLITAASAAAAAAFAAAPPAGTRIGNQAAATYTNVAGDQVTVTSNKVETIVQQVSGVDLETDLTEDASPGGKVFLPHTITNIGNGSDTFTLAATDADAGGNPYDFTSIRIFADADLDGVADSATPITVTPTLAPGDTFGIVIEALVPSSATPGAAEDITVTATSDFDGTTVDTNTDTITVSSGAITELQKSMTVVDTNADGLVSPGDRVDITITYSSTGLADAQNVVISDVLDAALTYDAGSATWSDSAVALTDAADAEANTNGAGDVASFSYDGTDTVDFTIDNIPAGRTGSFSFSATISANTPAGDIDNIATQTVDGVQAPPSNVPTITVDSVYRVSIADYEAGTYKVDPDDATNLITTGAVSAVDDDTTRNDIVEESSDVAQGSTIPFDFVITNHSNEDQTIAVSYANVDFPAGTSFQLLGSDGATPLVGPIGPLAPGETASVTLAAKLPADLGATAVTDYTATIIAQPVDGGDANSSTAEFSGAITGASVDLTNSAADGDGGDGPNATDGGAPWHEKAVDPDVTAVYTMEIENQGPTADSYDLSIAGLPAGYVATFTLADGTPITNTGSIPSGGVQTVLVNVIVPEDATPSSDDFSVTLLSPATGQGDTLTNRITVNEVVDVVIEHDQTGQAAAGGVLDIPHTLRNEGNTTITEGAITLAGDFANFSGTLFWDVNGDQIADSGDVVIDNIDDIVGGLAPGAEASLILRAQVPSTTSVGLTESETINVATSLNAASKVDSDASNNSVTDTVTVVSGDLTLVKRQAIDTACNGGAGGYSLTAVNAEPGQCIAYRIQAENTGTANATDVVITDSSPAWTTFTECGATCNATMTGGTTATLTKPAEGAAGQVRGEFGTLLPGQSAILDFTVQISN